jgi:hypothetical protein
MMGAAGGPGRLYGREVRRWGWPPNSPRGGLATGPAFMQGRTQSRAQREIATTELGRRLLEGDHGATQPPALRGDQQPRAAHDT